MDFGQKVYVHTVIKGLGSTIFYNSSTAFCGGCPPFWPVPAEVLLNSQSGTRYLYEYRLSGTSFRHELSHALYSLYRVRSCELLVPRSLRSLLVPSSTLTLTYNHIPKRTLQRPLWLYVGRRISRVLTTCKQACVVTDTGEKKYLLVLLGPP